MSHPLARLGGLGFAVAVILGPAAHAADIDAVQKSAAEWARIRTETARLESDWQWQQQLLATTNAALQERVRQLQARRDELKARTGGDRDELAELTTRNATATSAIATADQRLKQLTADVVALRASLPPRLSEALELPYRSLANPELSTGERMLYLTTVLNRCAQFNKSITYGDEPLMLPGETDRKLVNVVYWGLGQAYALDRMNGKAYTGAPADGRWSWQESPAAAEALTRIIAINQEKADPAFVELPVRIAHPADQTAQR